MSLDWQSSGRRHLSVLYTLQASEQAVARLMQKQPDPLGVVPRTHSLVWCLRFFTSNDSPTYGRLMWDQNCDIIFLDARGDALAIWQDLPQLDDPDITFARGVVLFSLVSTNCRDIESIDVTATEGPPEKWLRRKKQPQIAYKLLRLTASAQRKAARYHAA